jgi:hypothetical protein
VRIVEVLDPMTNDFVASTNARHLDNGISTSTLHASGVEMGFGARKTRE